MKSKLLAFSFLMGLGIVALLLSSSQLKFSLVAILVICIILLTFIRADLGLILLILSMLLSPEITIAEIPGKDLIIRLDDIIIGVVFLTWIARMAIYKELGVFKFTSLNKSIGIYTSCCVLFTILGMMRGDVSITGLFYIIKYLEYFLIFFMVVNLIKNKEQIQLYLVFMFITCAIVCIYAASNIGKVNRISAPFEGIGEPNTLGGYLMIITAIAIGLITYNPMRTRVKFLLLGLIGLSSLCIAYTLSRCTYVAFPVMYLTILVFSGKKKWLMIGFVFAILAFVAFKPKVVIDRINYTFIPPAREEAREKVFGIPIEASAGERIRSWRVKTKDIWTNSPMLGIIGTGATGKGFLDGQYMRTFIELGVIGFLAFLYLLWSMYREYLYVYRNTSIGLYKGLALGGLGALLGIYVHAITANSFIIIRIQEPLWFLTAMIVKIRETISVDYPVLKKNETLG